MPSAVVDASALVEVLIGGPAAATIFERVFRSRIEIHAPHSLDVEVANAVRRLARRQLLSDEDVDEIAAIYRDLKIAPRERAVSSSHLAVAPQHLVL